MADTFTPTAPRIEPSQITGQKLLEAAENAKRAGDKGAFQKLQAAAFNRAAQNAANAGDQEAAMKLRNAAQQSLQSSTGVQHDFHFEQSRQLATAND